MFIFPSFISGPECLDKRSQPSTRVEVSLKPLAMSVPMAEQAQALSPTNSKPPPVNNQHNPLRQSSQALRQSPSTVSTTGSISPVTTNQQPPRTTTAIPADVSALSPPAKRQLIPDSPLKNGNPSPPKVRLESRIVKKDGSPGGLKLHIRKEDLLRVKPKKHKHHHHHHHSHHKEKHRDKEHSRHHHHHHHKPKSTHGAADFVNNKDHVNLSTKQSQTDVTSSDLLQQMQNSQTENLKSQSCLDGKEPSQTTIQTQKTHANVSDNDSARASTATSQQQQQKPSGCDSDHMIKHADSWTRSDSACEFDKLIHIEHQANGGASVVHVYSDEIAYLKGEALERFAKYYFEIVYGESTPGVADHVMGIVHGSAAYLPDFIDYFAVKHPTTIVKTQVLGKSDIVTTTMPQFQRDVAKSYCNGTFRTGPLLQLSLVGTVNEEVGDFFEEFLDLLESNPFLKHSMPWGPISNVQMESRNHSNDGPILWIRPGEQMVPTADLPKSPAKGKRR